MYLRYLNLARATNPLNPANAVVGAPMPVANASGPAAPTTVLHIVNQNPNELALLKKTKIIAMFHRRAEAKEQSLKLCSGPNTNLGKIINTISDTLLHRFHDLRLIDNQGQPIDSEGRRIPRPPRPHRKFRYTEYKKAKKTSTSRYREIARRLSSAPTLMNKMKDNGELSFGIKKNWRDFRQIERFSSRIDYQDMIDRGTTYAYEREKKQFYSDPKNLDKPFYPRYLPIVVSRTKDIDDWRIKTGPNGQLIQPQIVMPSVSQNNNGGNSMAMDANDTATEVDENADDIAVDDFDDDEPFNLPPLPPRPGVYEFIPMTFRPPRYVPRLWSGKFLPFSNRLSGKSESEIRKGKFKAIQPAVDDLTGWDVACREARVWLNPRSTLNIEEGLVPPNAHHQHASRDPPPSPPGYSNPVPVPSFTARNQALFTPQVPLSRREPDPSTPIASGSGTQQPARRAPLQQLSQTQLPTTQPTSSARTNVLPPSLLSRLSPPDVRQEGNAGNENVGPSARSTYVEIPTAPNSAEATVTSFTDASPSQFQQPPILAATDTYAAPDLFTHVTYSVQEPQIPVAASAFPPLSQDTQSSSINIDNIMGWTTGSQPGAPTSWASLAEQVNTAPWWMTQEFQQPADTSSSIAMNDQPMDTSHSHQTAFADADMEMDAQMASPPPCNAQPQQPTLEQSPYSSDIPNGLPDQPEGRQNACSSDQQTTWASAPQMQASHQQLQICYQDSNTGAWLPYLDPQLQICIFDPGSQIYIPLQLSQSTYVGAFNPLGDQTQSSSSSMHTTFDSYQRHSAEQLQSSWSSTHATPYPSQQHAPGTDQQSSSSSMYTSSCPFEQYPPGVQQQSSISSIPTSSTTFAPLQSEYSSSHPVAVVQPQQPASWYQPPADPSVAATLAACNSWESAIAAVRSQDPPATTFDSAPVPAMASPERSWYHSEVDPSIAASQAAYNSGKLTPTTGYQDPSIPDATCLPLPQVPVDLQVIPDVDDVSQMEPWETAIEFNLDEEDILSDPCSVNTETARRQGAHPPPMRLRRSKHRRHEPPSVNDNSGSLFDAQTCKHVRMDRHALEKQGDELREFQTSSTPRLSPKKRSRDESERTATSSRRRTLDEDAEETQTIRPSKRARRTKSPVEPPTPPRIRPRDEFESSVTPSRILNAKEGTGPTRSSRRARRNDLTPCVPTPGRRVRWADPITTERYAAGLSRTPTRTAQRIQRNASPSKSDRFCPSLPGIARWFNIDGTRL